MLPLEHKYDLTIVSLVRQTPKPLPLDLTDVLGFYRRELGKLNWKEEAKGAKVSDDSAGDPRSRPGRIRQYSSLAGRTTRPP